MARKHHTHECASCGEPIRCDGINAGWPDCPPHCEYDDGEIWICENCGPEFVEEENEEADA